MNRGKGWSSEALQALNATGLSFEQGMREAADDLLYHELGHIYTVAYGIGPPNMWFNEFLANYLMEAYLAEDSPRSRVFGVARRDWFITLKPRYTSLDDLERLYIGVGVGITAGTRATSSGESCLSTRLRASISSDVSRRPFLPGRLRAGIRTYWTD